MKELKLLSPKLSKIGTRTRVRTYSTPLYMCKVTVWKILQQWFGITEVNSRGCRDNTFRVHHSDGKIKHVMNKKLPGLTP